MTTSDLWSARVLHSSQRTDRRPAPSLREVVDAADGAQWVIHASARVVDAGNFSWPSAGPANPDRWGQIGWGDPCPPIAPGRRRIVFPFAFVDDAQGREHDAYVHSGMACGVHIEKMIVASPEEADPIVDLQVDDRPMLWALRVESRTEEDSTYWTKVPAREVPAGEGARSPVHIFVTTWVPSGGPIVMRRRLRIRARDPQASRRHDETWAVASLFGTC